MILLIDNYDSFTYNLYQYIGELYHDIQVVRNDEITIEQIEEMHPQALILSPGPGYPKDAGITMETIRHFNGKIPMLGVCLGHQSICEAFGGTIVRAAHLMHGKASQMVLDTTSPIFAGLPKMVSCGRYHSLIAQESDFPECLKVTARDENGQIMALQHRETQTYGVQFHPESLLTGDGKRMLANFLNLIPGVSVELPPIVEDRPKTELKKYIAKVADGCDLTLEEAQDAMDIIMSGSATNAQIAGLLVALRMKGETIDEITGFAKGMRNKAKHGNRSVSSKSGAADVLESLGVKIQTTPEQAKASIQEIGISFLFAQSYHGAMKYVAPARKELGIRTVFNVLGPLTNPASTNYILLGVYEKAMLPVMARVLLGLGIKSAMIVYGNDRLDEVSISDKTSVAEVRDGKITEYEIAPEDFGFPRASKEEIVGGIADENAKITRGILDGSIRGAKRNIVLMNAGCALYVSGKAATIADGIRLAEQQIDSGKALEKLHELVEFTNRNA